MDDVWVIVRSLHRIGSQAGKWLSSYGARPKLRIVSKHMGREGVGQYLFHIQHLYKKLDLFPCFTLTWHIRLAGECAQASWRGVWSRWRTVDDCCLHLCVWGLHLDFQCSDRRVKSVLEMAGGGHSGLGRCRPSISGVSCGLWVALVGVQSPREAWAALRWAKRWVMEKPAFPSSCDSTTSTCLQREVKTKEERLQPSAFPKSMLFIETRDCMSSLRVKSSTKYFNKKTTTEV